MMIPRKLNSNFATEKKHKKVKHYNKFSTPMLTAKEVLKSPDIRRDMPATVKEKKTVRFEDEFKNDEVLYEAPVQNESDSDFSRQSLQSPADETISKLEQNVIQLPPPRIQSNENTPSNHFHTNPSSYFENSLISSYRKDELDKLERLENFQKFSQNFVSKSVFKKPEVRPVTKIKPLEGSYYDNYQSLTGYSDTAYTVRSTRVTTPPELHIDKYEVVSKTSKVVILHDNDTICQYDLLSCKLRFYSLD